MAAAGRQGPDTDALATSLREAGFVRLAPIATGDGVAAAGVLARALDAIGVPVQLTVADGTDARTTEADCTVAIGWADPEAEHTIVGPRPASATAFEVASAIAETESPALAAAGVLAAGAEPSGHLAEALSASGIERRPGVGIPVADHADGLAHSTLVHGPFSGDRAAVRDLLDPVGDATDEEARRRVASLVAVRTVAAEDVPPRAADAVERLLRPYAGGPVETIEGYADVLDAAVREEPGAALALALGADDASESALAAWRRHGEHAHEVLDAADARRHSGLVAIDCDGPVVTIARLFRDFRSPEPRTLVVGDERIALATAAEHDARAELDAVVDGFDESGRVLGTPDLARARSAADADRVVAALREVIRDV